MGVEPFVPFRRLLLVDRFLILPQRRADQTNHLAIEKPFSNLSGSSPPAKFPNCGRAGALFLLCVW